MDETTYERASRVLEALLGLPEAQRAQALERYPDLDDELRAEVASLLEHDRDDGFLVDPPARPSAPPLLPATIGGHRVLRHLGTGGMGAVYEVQDPELGRTVALKVMGEHLGGEEARLRFRLEIESLSRLEHPGIARIYRAGVDTSGPHQVPYFTMERVEGVTLDRWARESEPSLREVVAVVVRICEAIEHAHRNGLIHRDLKPANILVDAGGAPKVLDFGIARPVDGHDSLARATRGEPTVLGTLAYVSPEQCSGRGRDVDVRTDVYSIGALLYELLAGEPPIDVRDLSLAGAARRVSEELPRAPTRRGKALHRDLAAVVLHALEKRPDDRYPSVSELRKDLECWLEGAPVSARRSRSRALVAWASRRPLVATLIGSLSILLATLALTALSVWWLARRPDAVRHDASGMASVYSRAGVRLHSWDGPVLSATAMDGGRIALVRYFDERRVTAYATSAPWERLWSSADLAATPPGPQAPFEAYMRPRELAVDDFVPEREGEEVLVIEHLSPASANVLRILDAAGDVLYEVWHEGAIESFYWHAQERRLVCAGFNSGSTWIDRGVDLPEHPWPYVVFALDVEAGHVNARSFVSERERASDPTLAWYKWFGPIETLRAMPRCKPALFARTTHTGEVVLEATLLDISSELPRNQGGGVSLALHLDAAGQESGRHVSDEYRTARTQDRVPPMEAWRLLELETLVFPAIVEPVR